MSIIKKLITAILIIMMLMNNISMLIVYGKENYDNSISGSNTWAILSSTKYIISEEENLISRVLPETKVGILKGKFNMPKSHVKVYESRNNLVEVEDESYVATGMALSIEGSSKIYDISVIGDLNKDGQMGQIELNLLIKHVVGMELENNLQGILRKSIDINGDGQINQIDITILIRWIVYHELEIEEVEMPEAPNINVVQGTLEENGWYSNKVIVEIVAPEDKTIELDKITYVMTKKGNTVERGSNANNNQEEIEIESGKRLELKEDGIYEIKAYSYSKQGYRSVENKVEIKIDKADKIPPEGRIEVVETTTKEIKIEVKEAKDEGSGIESYTYYLGVKNEQGEYEYTQIKKCMEEEIGQEQSEQNQEEEKLKCTYENLKQNEEYKIVVEIKDRAGNVNRIEKIVKTKSMPRIQVSDIEISYSKTEWTNEDVEVTIKVREGVDTKDCILKYSLDGGKTWSKYEETVKVQIEENTNIIVKLTDGVNDLEVATGRVSNIDKELPEGSLKVKEVRSNTIAVEVEGKDYVSGINEYIYYIGTKNETGEIQYEEYEHQQVDQTPRENLKQEFKYEGLQKNAPYYIKVEIKDRAGNKIELLEEAITQKIPALNEQNMTFKKSEEGWTKNDVVVTVELDEDINQEEFHLEYSLDNGETWHDYEPETGIVVDHNTNVDVHLSDGNNIGDSNRLTVTNIDKTAPSVNITQKESTSSTIDVEVKAEDSQSGVDKYIYYLGEQNEVGEIEYKKYIEITKNEENTGRMYQYKNLKQDTTYYIKVEVLDKVGNVGVAFDEINTQRIPDGNQVIILTQDKKEWTKENVTVTITYEETVYNVEYSVDGQTWVKATNSGERITIEKNTTVYARLTDGQNTGVVTSIEITNIDKEKPVVQIHEILQINSDGFVENLHVTDNLSGISSITWYIRKQGENSFTEETQTHEVQGGEIAGKLDLTKQKIYKGLETGTYEVYAQILDVSGNKVETEVKQVTLKQVEDLTEENTIITVTPEGWTNKSVKVTVETSVKKENAGEYGLEEYQIEYSLDGENYYIYNEAGVEVEKNGTIYARLSDGKNKGNAISKKIEKIDVQAPQVGQIVVTEVTSKKLKVNLNMQDSLSGIGKIIWYYKHVNDKEYKTEEKEYTTLHGSQTGSLEQVVGELDLNDILSGEYSIYAEVYDVAGNMVNAKETLVNTLTIPEEAFTMTPDKTTWTNGSVTVTIELKEKTIPYDIEYSIDNCQSWEKGDSVTVTENTTVHAMLTDDINKGGVKSLKIANIDTTKTTIGNITTTNVTSRSMTAQINVKDQESGLGKIKWYYKNNTLNGEYKEVEQTYQTGNGENKGYTDEQIKNLELKDLNSGEYSIYAKVYDVAGNEITATAVTKNTETIPDADTSIEMILNQNYWTKEDVIVTLTNNQTKYSTEYSTNGSTYTVGTDVEMTSNGQVYARLTDGINSGKEKQISVDKIDKQAPEVGQITTKTTAENSLTVQVTINDDLSGLAKIEWHYKKHDKQNYTIVKNEYQDVNGETKGDTSTTQELVIDDFSFGEYDIYVKVYDVAGNTAQSEVTKLSINN